MRELLIVATALSLSMGCGPDRKDVVHEDVRLMVSAVYSGDVDTVMRYTHPLVVEDLGGEEEARMAVTLGFELFDKAGLKLESLEFPSDPDFVKGKGYRYVVVPTRSVITAMGTRTDSSGYQFGARAINDDQWRYVDGTRLTQARVASMFPDFPSDYTLPTIQRKPL